MLQEARDLCVTARKLRFHAAELQWRLEMIIGDLHRDAYANPPQVRVGVVTMLWKFLMSANEHLAEKHATLVNSLRIQQTNAARAKSLDRQQVGDKSFWREEDVVVVGWGWGGRWSWR